MKKLAITLSGLLLSASSLAATSEAGTALQCAAQKDWAHAEYTFTEKHGDTLSQKKLVLWRKPNVVAHEYPSNQITQMWEHVHERLKATRFFDSYARAIEYQPGEVIHGRVDNDWEYRNQLIKNDFIAQLERVSTQGEGCDQEDHYRLEKNNEIIELVWLPAQDLLVSFSVKRGDNEIRWQQDTLSHDQQPIRDFFAKRAEFQTTDFADIGDDHTDPFLTNMVHQGFIEAGASGFYDANGNAIGEHHH